MKKSILFIILAWIIALIGLYKYAEYKANRSDFKKCMSKHELQYTDGNCEFCDDLVTYKKRKILDYIIDSDGLVNTTFIEPSASSRLDTVGEDGLSPTDFEELKEHSIPF